MNSDKKHLAELEAKVIRLESLVEKLLDEIDDLTHRKNSRNSSVSPSKDALRTTLRKPKLKLK